MELNSKSFELWAEQFDKFSRNRILSNECAESVITMMLSPKMDEDNSLRDGLSKLYGARIILSRLKLFDYEMTNRAVIFLFMNVKSPGDIVMYLTYLQWKCWKSKIRNVTLDYLAKEVFPCGFVSDNDLLKAWDLQKCDDRTNLLDKYAYMSSIRF